MSGPCKSFLDDLPLYVEGELGDAHREARLRLHLESCPGCRELLLGYEEMTRLLREADWSAPPEEGPPASGPSAGHPLFVERVMAKVRPLRSESPGDLEPLSGPPARRRSLAAAAVLLLGGLVAGGLFIRFGPSVLRSPETSSKVAALSEPGRSSPGTPASRTAPGQALDRPQLVKDGGLPAGLESRWWVVGPERDLDEAVARESEAVLYALVNRDAPREARDYLVWKTFLGSSSRKQAARGGGLRFFLVPVDGGEGLAARPVTLPFRVAEEDLAPPARLRLVAPTRRYRILWQGSQEPPVVPGSDSLPSSGRSARPFLEPQEPPIELPLSPRRY